MSEGKRKRTLKVLYTPTKSTGPGGRTGLTPKAKKPRNEWTSEQEKYLLQTVDVLGTVWADVTKLFNEEFKRTLTVNSVKNAYSRLIARPSTEDAACQTEETPHHPFSVPEERPKETQECQTQTETERPETQECQTQTETEICPPAVIPTPRAPLPKKTIGGIEPRVVVSVHYESGTKTRKVSEEPLQRFMKAFVKGEKPDVLSKLLYRSTLREALNRCALNCVRLEVKSLASDKLPSILRQNGPENLENLKLFPIIEEWRERAPMLLKFLESACAHDAGHKDYHIDPYIPTMVLAGCVLLFQRNRKLSQMQYAIGLLVDQGGLTDRMITLLNRYKITTSPAAILQKRHQLQLHHQQKLADRYITDKVAVEDCLKLTPAPSDPVLPRSLSEGVINHELLSYEVLGDNIDFVQKPTYVTKTKQKADIHWFLNVLVKKRIQAPWIKNDPQKSLKTAPNHLFLPSIEEQHALRADKISHVARVLHKYMPCLSSLEKPPQFIKHDYMDFTTKRSTYDLAEILDKNENQGDDMIEILQFVHRNYVPTDDKQGMLSTLNFGGDVCTAEKAAGSQRAMANASGTEENVIGIVPRPEGLHRIMLLVQVR